MIRINLLPVKELKAEVGRRREVVIATVSLVVTVAAILGVYLYQLNRASILETELAELRSELQVFNRKAKEVGIIQGKIKEYQSKLQVLDSINKKKSGPFGVMEACPPPHPARYGSPGSGKLGEMSRLPEWRWITKPSRSF